MDGLQLFYRLLRPFILLFVAIFVSSCHVSSKTALNGAGGRTSYNESIQNTSLQQMLLNLVRLRYCDTPFFLDVTNITTQFAYNSFLNPSVPIPGGNNTNPIQIGAGFSWHNQPTIQYTPVGGKEFAIQLMHPINLITIQQLLLSGWDIDRLFKITIQSLDEHQNAPFASSPFPEYMPHFKQFFEIMQMLRHFQLHNILKVGVKEFKIKEEEEIKKIHGTALQISFPTDEPDADKLASLLEGVKVTKDRYILDMDLAYNEDAEIGIMPRSLLGCMYYLSLSVQIPEADLRAGRAFTTKKLDGSPFDWQEVLGNLMTIHHSVNYPENSFAAVKYKDYWFYIDSSDNNSKKTFVLLLILYNLQSGGEDARKQNPTLLTIPLG